MCADIVIATHGLLGGGVRSKLTLQPRKGAQWFRMIHGSHCKPVHLARWSPFESERSLPATAPCCASCRPDSGLLLCPPAPPSNHEEVGCNSMPPPPPIPSKVSPGMSVLLPSLPALWLHPDLSPRGSASLGFVKGRPLPSKELSC